MAKVSEVTVGSDWAVYQNGETVRGVVTGSTIKKPYSRSKRGTRHYQVRLDNGDYLELQSDGLLKRWEAWTTEQAQSEERTRRRAQLIKALDDLPFKVSVSVFSNGRAQIQLTGIRDLFRPVIAEHIPAVFELSIGSIHLTLEPEAVEALLQLPQTQLLSLARELEADWE